MTNWNRVRVAGLQFAHFIHDKLPRAFGKIGIAVLQIDLGDLKVDDRLFAGFVLCVDEASCFSPVFCLQTFPLLRDSIERIEGAVFTAIDAVTVFHGSCVEPLTEPFRRVNEYWELAVCLLVA